MNNYISRFHTNYGVYHIYHSNMILFGGRELSELIFPGLFHELKTHCKYSEMFDEAISSPSCYKLPDYISPDKLIEELRSTLANTLVFIHTWCNENSTPTITSLLNSKYEIYEQFFDAILSFILVNELQQPIKDLAYDLKNSVKKIYSYLGPYHTNLKQCVYNTHQIIMALITVIYLRSFFLEVF
jgi:hypothetical protein